MVSYDDIDEVLLVGGSSRVPCFKNSITNLFKIKPSNVLNVDEVVSLGASVNTALREKSTLTDKQKELLQNVSFTDAANCFLGVLSAISKERIIAETGNQDYDGPGMLVNTVIIHKNTPTPCEKSEMFQLAERNFELSEIKISLTQSNINSVDPNDVTIIKETVCKLSDKMEPEDLIEIIYEWDEDQLIQCNFKHVKTLLNMF